MIVPQAAIDLVLRPKGRQKIIHLPVRRGKHGERKRCPMRKGGVYRLKAPIPYERYRSEAHDQPSNARAVLWLIEQCERPRRTVTITVVDVEMQDLEDGKVWAVSFLKGDHGTTSDKPVWLARYGDFTTLSSRQSVPGDPELAMAVPGDAERARVVAIAQRVHPQQESVRRATSEVETLRHSMLGMKARNRVKLIQRELVKLAAELPPDQDLQCA